jgi:hypothetical protein
MAEQGARHFLPWVRQGSAAGIANADSLTPNQPAQVSVSVAIKFAEFNVASQVQLYGPADVTAIDPRQIVRTEPRPFTTDYPYNLFPSIEFDRPDFPWLFTPARAGANERLRPWVCLVVVKKQDGVRITRTNGAALPVLEIAAPARPELELPDLEESWAWTHAQISGAITDNAAALQSAIRQAPERTVSRLLCPRRLDPTTGYYACVVPAFDVGRKTGVGLPVTETELGQLAPAWLTSSSAVSLPVYYTWEFSTGENADFESLVRLLQPRPVDNRVGTVPVDISAPGFGLPSQPDAILPMRGVLQPASLAGTTPPAVPQGLQTDLAKLLNAPADALTQSVSDPVVAPPIYGASYPPKDRVEVTPTPPLWLNELNLDPRHRIAAGLGTEIIQQDQEPLMASAWQQAEELRRANQQQRLNQLAVTTRAATYTKQVSRLDKDELLQITGPSMAKIPASGPPDLRTSAAQVWSSEFPAFSAPALRRLARPRGPVNRRFLARDFVATQNRRLVKLVDTLPPPVRRPGSLPVSVITRQLVSSMVSIRKVSAAAGLPSVDANKLTPAAVAAQPAGGFFVWKTDPSGQIPGHWERSTVQFGQQFRQAALDHLNRVIRPKPTPLIRPITPDTSALLAQLNPQSSSPRALAVTRGVGSEDDTLIAYPEFPRPMSERLIELAPEFLLPGLENVPPNTVTLVQPNARFIEAFMVGLNHEMGRELLWREYPTDRRGTYFKYFWDEGGTTPTQPSAVDLPPIHLWAKALGQNASEGRPEPLILLVRGQLFRRYPNALLYAAKAERDTAGRIKPGATERFPLFRGVAPPDVTFFGFQLTEAEARGSAQPGGDPGWFFVIQQQPGEPEFGLDVDPGGDPVPVTEWNQLTWRHLVRSGQELAALTHVRIKQGSPPRPDTSKNPPGATWGFNAAHMARITMQQPVRIAILASQMLPPLTGSNTHG